MHMNDTVKDILRRVDHTLLSQGATWEEIRAICDDGVKYGCASVCIPASYVKQAAEYVAGKIAICTVIGFPNGYSTTAAKCFEARDAVENGASEIDMVINIGWVKDGLYDKVLEEIKAVKAACGGKLLKVIIETCLLTDAEKIEMCRVVSDSGAEYIKTSTGFGGGGATREDVALFKAHVAPHVKIKAAGGIANLQDAEDFVALAAGGPAGERPPAGITLRRGDHPPGPDRIRCRKAAFPDLLRKGCFCLLFILRPVPGLPAPGCPRLPAPGAGCRAGRPSALCSRCKG